MNIWSSDLFEKYIYKVLVLVVFGAYVYIFTCQIYRNIQFENGYTFGDWLINYEDGGFKRRGLSGSFFIFLFDNLKIDIKNSVFVFQFLLNLIFIGCFSLLLLKKKVSLNFLILILSPCTFLFFFNELGSIGRKEIIIYSCYAFYLFRFSNTRLSIWKVFFPFIFVVPLAILFHELFFFYSPFFLVPLFTTEKHRFSLRDKFTVIFVFFVISVSTMFLLFFYGGEINQGSSFNILEARGVSKGMRQLGNMGILTWNDNFDKIAYFVNNDYYKYLITLLLGFLTFYFAIISRRFKINRKEFIFTFILTFLCSLPVYILAIDWGRWINIHFVLLLIFFGSAIKGHGKSSEIGDKKMLIYLAFALLLLLFWRFELVDKGFFISEFIFKVV